MYMYMLILLTTHLYSPLIWSHLVSSLGRFGEEFVEKRRAKLEMWTNRIARHPVLSRCDVFQHFVTCPDSDQTVSTVMYTSTLYMYVLYISIILNSNVLYMYMVYMYISKGLTVFV